MKISYFALQNKWARRSNFESVIRFVGEELVESDLQHHLKYDCSLNITMMSPKAVDQFQDNKETS